MRLAGEQHAVGCRGIGFGVMVSFGGQLSASCYATRLSNYAIAFNESTLFALCLTFFISEGLDMPVKNWSFKPFWLKRWVTGDQGEIVYGSQTYMYNYLYGGPGADTIIGCGTHYTLMEGKEGNDSLLAGPCGVDMYGGTGRDTLRGGVGDDTLHGDEGNDLLIGGGGSDSISDISGDNKIYAEDGNDHIFVRDGIQKIYAGNGDDTITAQSVDGTYFESSDLRGEYGNDKITVDSSDVFEVWGGPGNDTIEATSADVSDVWGEEGNDSIEMYGSHLSAYGGAGADVIDFNNAIESAVCYQSRSESQRGASDTIRNLRGDNRVGFSAQMGFHWAQNGHDKSNGALHIENNWTNSRIYSYNAAGNVDFEITFKSSASLTRNFFDLFL